jgi:putative spermidine/putrescine transport system permease protein
MATSLSQKAGVSLVPTRARSDPVQGVGRAFALATAFLCLAPIPLVVAVAISSNWALGFGTGGLTTRWLVEGWQQISPYAFFSLRLAALILVLDVLIGLPTAWLLARYRFPGRQLLNSLTMAPIAVPGIAMALALILAYPDMRGDGRLLVAGHLLYTLPYFIGALVAPLANPRLRELESVAATLGAGGVKRFLFIVLPQIRGALLAATIMVVTLSIGEFNVSFFLFTPTLKPLPIELYSAYITGRVEQAAAITLCFLLFVIPATIALERLGGGRVGQA